MRFSTILRSYLALAPLAMAAAASPARLVWSGPEVNLLGGPSRDGRYLSYVDRATGNLAIRETASGTSRLLTKKQPGSKEFAYFSAISPDSQRVAYAWFNEQGFYDLRVIGLDGTHQRILYRNEEAGFVQPCTWSPDGKHVLTLFFRTDNISQIALVPAAGGAPKILRSLNWVYPKRMDFSPDGRFIAYDSFAQAGGNDRTVFILSTSGDQETRLVTEPGSHLFPLWSPDGKYVAYASDRGGAMGAWTIPVEDGKPSGAPRLLRADIGRALPMGITQQGDYYYGVRSGESDVFVTTLAKPTEKPLRVTIRFPGRNTSPAWSADGKTLAFLSRRGAENFGEESRDIVIRSIDPDEERELAPKLGHMERLRWSPDGTSLLVSGTDGKGRAGVFIVDAKSAAVRPVASEAGGVFRGFPGCWSRDGKSIYYIHGETELRSHDLGNGKETVLMRGKELRQLVISPEDDRLAVANGESILVIEGTEKRPIAFAGVTELEWGHELVAARGTDLWRVPVDGSAPERLEMPGNRMTGFSLHPDGKRMALTAGRERSEVWALKLP